MGPADPDGAQSGSPVRAQRPKPLRQQGLIGERRCSAPRPQRNSRLTPTANTSSPAISNSPLLVPRLPLKIGVHNPVFKRQMCAAPPSAFVVSRHANWPHGGHQAGRSPGAGAGVLVAVHRGRSGDLGAARRLEHHPAKLDAALVPDSSPTKVLFAQPPALCRALSEPIRPHPPPVTGRLPAAAIHETSKGRQVQPIGSVTKVVALIHMN